MLERWRKTFRPAPEQEPERISPPYILSVHNFPQEILQRGGNNIIMETNAGGNPIGMQLAEANANHIVIAQDVREPDATILDTWSQRITEMAHVPSNFYYAVGEISDLPYFAPTALLSLLPAPSQNTIDWLSQTLIKFLERNPLLYAAVITEDSTSDFLAPNTHPFSVSHPLQEALDSHDIHPNVSSINFSAVLKRFPTRWVRNVANRYLSADIIELNPQRRDAFAFNF